MSRWEPRSNRASHTPDTGGSAAPQSRVPPNVFGESRISVVVVEGESAVGSGGADAVGPPIQVVGHVSVGPDAVALVERVRPDVVLLQVDATCPAASETIEALRANHPLTRIVVADVQHEGAAPQVVGDEGGCVVTDSAFADVIAGIQRAAGEGAGSPAAGGGAAVRRHGVGPALTRREHDPAAGGAGQHQQRDRAAAGPGRQHGQDLLAAGAAQAVGPQPGRGHRPSPRSALDLTKVT